MYGEIATPIPRTLTIDNEAAFYLGVKELELNGNFQSDLRIPVMIPLRSPAVLYDTRHSFRDKQKALGFSFDFNPRIIRRTKRRTTRTNTTPVLSTTAKHCFLLSALSPRYSVESMTTSLIKGNASEQGAMFMPTHTVLILGEISVGKSALCRQFFRSGMRTDAKIFPTSESTDFGEEDEYPEIQAEDGEAPGGIVHSNTR